MTCVSMKGSSCYRRTLNFFFSTFFILWLSVANILILLPLPLMVVTSHPVHTPRAIGQNIRQLPCKGKSLSARGVCMFALDCIKSNGTHLGTCIDRFYFGSCCHLSVESYNKYSSATNKPTYNDIPGSIIESSGLTTKNKFVGTTSSSSRLKPTSGPTVTEIPSSSTTTSEKLTITTPITFATTLVTDSDTTTTTSLLSTSESNTWTTTTGDEITTLTITESETIDYNDVFTDTIDNNIVTDDFVEMTVTTMPSVPPTTILPPTSSKPTPTTKGTTRSPSSETSNTRTTVVPATRPNTITETTTTNSTSTADDNIESTNATSTDSTTTGFDITKLAEMDYHAACGRQLYKERPTGRIVNGQKTQFGEWPWQISLRQWKRTTFMHKCGAALLNENWAITAAHCVDGVLPEDLLLRIGEFDLSSDSETLPHVERRVQIMTIHPEFNSRTFENDLALLRFYDPVTFQINIIPICLPTDDNNFVNKTGFVTGWGRLYVDGPLPNILQEVQVPVITNAECEQEYRRAGFLESIPDIFLCAGYDDGGRDSCEGDSGGPLVIKQSSDRYVLAGIISWGIGCAEPHQPGVYTRISRFREWINQILVF